MTLLSRERVAVLDGDPVKAPIVNAETEAAIAFLDEQDRCAGGRRGSLDVALGEILLDVLIERFELYF